MSSPQRAGVEDAVDTDHSSTDNPIAPIQIQTKVTDEVDEQVCPVATDSNHSMSNNCTAAACATFKKSSSSDNYDGECDDPPTCLICFDEIKPGESVDLPCNCKGDNRFCMRCFDRSLAASLMSSGIASCPTCRLPIEVDFNPIDGSMQFRKGIGLPEVMPGSPPGARLRDANRRVEETRTRIFAQMRPLLVERLSDFGKRRQNYIEDLQESHAKRMEEKLKLKEQEREEKDKDKNKDNKTKTKTDSFAEAETAPCSPAAKATNPQTVSSKPIAFIPRPSDSSNHSSAAVSNAAPPSSASNTSNVAGNCKLEKKNTVESTAAGSQCVDPEREVPPASNPEFADLDFCPPASSSLSSAVDTSNSTHANNKNTSNGSCKNKKSKDNLDDNADSSAGMCLLPGQIESSGAASEEEEVSIPEADESGDNADSRRTPLNESSRNSVFSCQSCLSNFRFNTGIDAVSLPTCGCGGVLTPQSLTQRCQAICASLGNISREFWRVVCPTVRCDLCNLAVAPERTAYVWNCSNGDNTILHPTSFDICSTCFMQHTGVTQAQHDAMMPPLPPADDFWDYEDEYEDEDGEEFGEFQDRFWGDVDVELLDVDDAPTGTDADDWMEQQLNEQITRLEAQAQAARERSDFMPVQEAPFDANELSERVPVPSWVRPSDVGRMIELQTARRDQTGMNTTFMTEPGESSDYSSDTDQVFHHDDDDYIDDEELEEDSEGSGSVASSTHTLTVITRPPPPPPAAAPVEPPAHVDLDVVSDQLAASDDANIVREENNQDQLQEDGNNHLLQEDDTGGGPVPRIVAAHPRPL